MQLSFDDISSLKVAGTLFLLTKLFTNSKRGTGSYPRVPLLKYSVPGLDGRYLRVHLLNLLLLGLTQLRPAKKFHIFLRELRWKLVAREPIQGLSETVVLDTPGKRAHPQDAWANWWSVPSDYPGPSSGLTRLREPLSTGSLQLSYSIFTVPVPEKVQPSSQGESPPSSEVPESAKQRKSRSPPSESPGSEVPESAKQ